MRLSTRPTLQRRSGFTLVEVLVAAGLCMLIMVMVTTAFQRAMDTLSQLKSVGEMQQRLRSFETAIRGDLEAEHFEGGPRRVRDIRLDLLNSTQLTNDLAPARPPQMGFFRITQGSLSTVEGIDRDNTPSTRATDHILHMTVKRDASRGDRLFTASMPSTFANWAMINPYSMGQMNTASNTVTSNWGEVLYFLDTQNQVGTTPGGLPLYGLYRRTRVVLASGDPSAVNYATLTSTMSAPDKAACYALSNSAVTGRLNGPAELRNPLNRLGGILASRGANAQTQITAEKDASGFTGSDLLMTDVLSFEIKGDWDIGNNGAPGTFTQVPTPRNTNLPSYEFPFGDFPPVDGARNTALAGRRVFDTWYDTNSNGWVRPQAGASDCVPMPIRLRAIQIKVRVWDRKNNMARQVTIIQDL